MRLTWMTDIHFNFCGTQQIETFLHEVKAEKPDAVLITGDIGESHSLVDYLIRIGDTLAVPVYFVLGNHDYYHSNIANVRRIIKRVCELHPDLVYLTQEKVIQLTPEIALIGHDGWSDGRYGDFFRSGIALNDYSLIQDLAGAADKTALLHQLHKLGNETARHLRDVLTLAQSKYQKIFVMLHPPPFQQAIWYEDKTPGDDDEYLPHFGCKAAGDVLLEFASNHTDNEFIVLCGHTHGAGEAQILPNLRVLTGGAVYREPEIQRTFEL